MTYVNLKTWTALLVSPDRAKSAFHCVPTDRAKGADTLISMKMVFYQVKRCIVYTYISQCHVRKETLGGEGRGMERSYLHHPEGMWWHGMFILFVRLSEPLRPYRRPRCPSPSSWHAINLLAPHLVSMGTNAHTFKMLITHCNTFH